MKYYDAIAAFGENIRKFRTANQIAKKELAQRLGIGIRTFNKIEQGILPERLSCEVLDRAVILFGVSHDRLFFPLEDLPPEGE